VKIEEQNQKQKWYGPACYQIKIRGSLGENASSIFDGMDISFENGCTVIRGDVVDQSALHGILNQIRNLGMQLVSLERIEHDHNN